QDHDIAHGGGTAAAGRRLDPRVRHRCAARSRRGEAHRRVGVGRADDLRQAHAVRISRVRRRPVEPQRGHRGDARAGADGLARPQPTRARALRGLFQGHAAEGGARGRAGARATRDHPRRALDRPRCRLRAAGQARAARAGRGRRHRDHDHAYPRGCRTHGRPRRHHRRRTADRLSRAGRAARAGRPRPFEPGRHLPCARRRAAGRGVSAGSITWFANHELRLAWRDFLSMMTAGRRGRERVVALALTIFIVFAHVLAWYFVARYVDVGTGPDKPTLVVITGTVLLSWSLLMSQAMESVTRAFYARSDLDLILSSPTAARKIFAVRIGAMALSVILMAALIGAPIINVAIARGGARWLGAYGVVIAMGATAAAGAVALTVALFCTIGPKRTRLAAQIVAAVIAAVFIIGLQVAAILSHGSLSRMVFLESDMLVALVPEVDSVLCGAA